MGGSMLLFRQFVQRQDYELFVMTDQRNFTSEHFPSLVIEHPQFIQRLQRTRFSLLAHDYVHLLASRRIPRQVLQSCLDFRPDLIVTGAETWIADLAIRLARRMRVPVAGYFMDWPTYGMLGHHAVKTWCSRQFLRRYAACNLAFGICPEMLEALGPHPNSHVFYPPGSHRTSVPGTSVNQSREKPFRCLFAGNLGEWYGEMLLNLAARCQNEPSLGLRIAGRNATWSEAQIQELTASGVFCGFLKGDPYEAELRRADVLLVLMGFGEECRLIESTSFKSKLADYLAMGKPILVWGPDYSTAVRSARQYQYAAVVDSPDPGEVMAELKRMAADPHRCQDLVVRGQQFFDEFLEPNRVFSRALAAMNSVIDASHSANGIAGLTT
jgi:hypothetical protein